MLAEAFEQGNEPENLTARLFVQLAQSAGNDPLAMAACLRRDDEPFTAEEIGTRHVPDARHHRRHATSRGPPDPLVDALPDAQLACCPASTTSASTSEFACIDAALEFVDAVPYRAVSSVRIAHVNTQFAGSDAEQSPAHGFGDEEPLVGVDVVEPGRDLGPAPHDPRVVLLRRDAEGPERARIGGDRRPEQIGVREAVGERR